MRKRKMEKSVSKDNHMLLHASEQPVGLVGFAVMFKVTQYGLKNSPEHSESTWLIIVSVIMPLTCLHPPALPCLSMAWGGLILCSSHSVAVKVTKTKSRKISCGHI